MSFPSGTGANLLLDRNPANGKAIPVWSSGNMAFTDDMAEVILSLLLEDESGTTAGRRVGPSLLSVRLDTVDAPAQLENYARQRLQLALDDGRLKSVEVSSQRVDRGKISVGVAYIDRAGRRDLITVPLGSF